MAGERDMATLLRSVQPVLQSGTYVFTTIPHGAPMPPSVWPVMTFREEEGVTLVVCQEEAEAAGLPGAFPSRLITLGVHSALEAVGFLAAITARLAEAGISVNAVSAFNHDHLFVPVQRADEAIRVLEDLARG